MGSYIDKVVLYSRSFNRTKMKKVEVVAFVMVLIDFCLSVACVAMGALHLNECQNQAATFLLVNGGVTLALTLIVIALIILYRIEAGQVINLSFCVLSLVKMVLSINGSIAIFGSSIDNCHEATFIFAYAMVITNWVAAAGLSISFGFLCYN